jgi:predicted enzyme related to lactoylglutathione lyase
MIDGIGGVFLFSNDTKRLAAWYRDCLGIVPAGEDADCNSIYATFESRDIANPDIKRTTAWAIMPTDQDIKDKPRTGKINYRVKNMAEVLDNLKTKGVAVDKTEQYPGYGSFAWLKDPDGNQIELWEAVEERVEAANS